jgi:hypothetical protein
MNIEALGLVDGLAQLIPQFAQKLLHVGLSSDALATALRARSGAEVTGIQFTTSGVVFPLRLPECVHPGHPETDDNPLSGRTFDGVILETVRLAEPELATLVAQLAPLLSDDGFLLLVVIHDPAVGVRFSEPAVASLVDRAGLAFYTTNALATEQEYAAIGADAGANVTAANQSGFLLWAVRPTYNPLLHARKLFKSGRPGWAYEVLDLVPDALVQEPEVRAAYYSERLLSLLAWDKLADPATRLGRFFHAQSMFYEATWNVPANPLPFLCQSEFWRRLGDSDMAARLLRTIRHIAPSPEIERRLDAVAGAVSSSSSAERSPEWETPKRLPRVLFVLPDRPHYGLDVLYDGLCTVLGDDRVVDFPWKSTLHGAVPRKLVNYPCTFNRRGTASKLDALVEELRNGSFDLILLGDVEQHVGVEAIRSILDTAPKLPLFVVDEQDDPLNNLPDTLAFLGRESVDGYFKREMLACHDYGITARPLPFAYADSKVPRELNWVREEPLFWAGHRQFGLRRVYVERVEQRLGRSFDRKYTQQEYTDALQHCRIGLNLFGFGYDTVRYWELAAHGCMILSERLPIRIPHNFVNDESAVFFDDLPDMEEKFAYYLAHPEEAEQIARRGHDLFKKYHTASARARQLLACVDELLRI